MCGALYDLLAACPIIRTSSHCVATLPNTREDGCKNLHGIILCLLKQQTLKKCCTRRGCIQRSNLVGVFTW